MIIIITETKTIALFQRVWAYVSVEINKYDMVSFICRSRFSLCQARSHGGLPPPKKKLFFAYPKKSNKHHFNSYYFTICIAP